MVAVLSGLVPGPNPDVSTLRRVCSMPFRGRRRRIVCPLGVIGAYAEPLTLQCFCSVVEFCVLLVLFFGLALTHFCRHKPCDHRSVVALIAQTHGRLWPRPERRLGSRGVMKGLARALPEGGVNLQSFTHSVEVSSRAPAVVAARGLTVSRLWLGQ